MTTKSRESSLARWFGQLMQERGEGAPAQPPELAAVSGDASFRRYFRVFHRGVSYILMDAPPNQEDCRPFVRIARRFRAAGVQVPVIHGADLEQGFICLADFGNTLLWEMLDLAQRKTLMQTESALRLRSPAGVLYGQAFAALLRIQAVPVDADFPLPPYDEALLQRELALFRQWFCEGLLGMSLDERASAMLDDCFGFLTAAALAQPRVCVHRDFHSRNLMVLEDDGLGVLDFQDAVHGPLSYDLVSLLKDCYISWPRAEVNDWALEYAREAHAAGLLPEWQPEEFLRDFDLMGVQRHLKAIGIFARLHLRDGKSRYLNDIPRTLGYVREVAAEHEALRDLSTWLEELLMPALEDRLLPLLSRREPA